MADIASTNVTYTKQSMDIQDKYREAVFKLQFGNGILTYPAGGVPLLKAKLGMPNELRSLDLMDMDDSNGLLYKYDFETAKLRIYEGDYAQVGDAPLAELDAGSDAPAATTLYVKAMGW